MEVMLVELASVSPDTDRRFVERAIARGLTDAPTVQRALAAQAGGSLTGKRATMARLLCETGVLAPAAAAAIVREVRAERATQARPGATGPAPSFLDVSVSGPSGVGSGLLGVGDRLGPYVVVSELGRGGMGAVYRVRHAATGAEYALKVILSALDENDPDAAAELDRFRREAEVLARIDGHPGVVRVYSFGRAGGTLYSVMELVSGRSLDRLYADAPATPRDAARIVADVARAIEHVHRHGVLHRDLKPANVIVDDHGTVRVLDFGLALDTNARERLTLTAEILGTPAFMAPEQIDPELTGSGVGPATDVWGLGAVLYALVTGVPPFVARDALGTMQLVLTEHPAPPGRLTDGRVPEDLEAICLNALEKAPVDRYGSASALAADLDRWIAGEPIEAARLGALEQIGRRLLPARGKARRSRILGARVILGALAVLAVSALAIFAVTRSVRESRDAAMDETRRFDEAFARATDEATAADARLPALAEALELRERVAAHSPSQRLEVARVLGKLVERPAAVASSMGSEGQLDFALPPWSAYREATVRILVAADRFDVIAALIQTPECHFVGRGAPADVLAERILEEDLGIGEELCKALDEALRQQADDHELPPEERDRHELQRLRVRLWTALLLDEVDGDWSPTDTRPLDRILERLVPLLRLEPCPTELAPVARRLCPPRPEGVPGNDPWMPNCAFDLASDDLKSDVFTREATLRFLAVGSPEDKAYRAQFVDRIVFMGTEVIALTPEKRRKLLRLARAALATGDLPYGVRRLVDFVDASALGTLEARAEIIARGAETIDPVELWAATAMILILDEDARRAEDARRDQETDTHEARRVALRRGWAYIERLLELERAGRDVPAWVLADIGGVLLDADPERFEPDRAESLAALLEVKPTLENARQTWNEIFGELFARVAERADPNESRIEPWLHRARFLIMRVPGPERDDEELAAVLITGLRSVSRANRRSGFEASLDPRGGELAKLAVDVGHSFLEHHDRNAFHCDAITRIIESSRRVIPERPLSWELELDHLWHHEWVDSIAPTLASARSAVTNRDHRGRGDWRSAEVYHAARLAIARGDPTGARAILEEADAEDLVHRPHRRRRLATLWDVLGEPVRASRMLELAADAWEYQAATGSWRPDIDRFEAAIDLLESIVRSLQVGDRSRIEALFARALETLAASHRVALGAGRFARRADDLANDEGIPAAQAAALHDLAARVWESAPADARNAVEIGEGIGRSSDLAANLWQKAGGPHASRLAALVRAADGWTRAGRPETAAARLSSAATLAEHLGRADEAAELRRRARSLAGD